VPHLCGFYSGDVSGRTIPLVSYTNRFVILDVKALLLFSSWRGEAIF